MASRLFAQPASSGGELEALAGAEAGSRAGSEGAASAGARSRRAAGGGGRRRRTTASRRTAASSESVDATGASCCDSCCSCCCARDGCCRRGCSRSCWQRWVDRYVRTLRLQALAFSIVMFLLQIYTAIVFFNMKVLNTLYLNLISWPIFLPMVALGLNIIVLTLSIAKTPHRAVTRKLVSTVLAIMTGVVFGVYLYSTLKLIGTGRTVGEVGDMSSQDIEPGIGQNVNDLTAALFESCCVNRGWAFQALVPCSDIQDISECPYFEYERRCVCILDTALYESFRGRMTSTYCTGVTFSQFLSFANLTNLVAPPTRAYQGCGSSEATRYLTGAPNHFQVVFARYYSTVLTSSLGVNLVFLMAWIISQAIGYGIKLIRYLEIQRDEVSRKRRRKEIMRKKATIKDLHRNGWVTPGQHLAPLTP